MLPQNKLSEKHDNHQLTETENMVSVIWSEVLQVDNVNPEDNFFELGGDSLMTMMVMFRVNDILGSELPPYSINQSPTLREFCKIIDENCSISDSQETSGNIELDSFNEEVGVI